MRNNKFTLPAEWHEQSAVQLTWPHSGTDWRPILKDVTRCYLDMAKAIAGRQQLIIVTPEPYEVQRLLRKTLSAADMRRIVLCEAPSNDTWARDHGFLTLISPEASPRLLDFKFNGWGKKFPSKFDNCICRRMARQGILTGRYENHLDFVLEGGSIESDGRGTIMTTSQCLLAPNRNQPLSQAQIEERLLKTLHAERILWLDHGNLAGDDTDGHIDTIVRTCPNDTLAYVSCDDPEDEQYADFRALEEELKTLTTLDGRPYRLLPLPMPRRMEDDGYRLPATYANFVILNGAVLVPTYQQPDNDEQAKAVIAKAFPDRDIIGIDASTVVRQHGSLHCLTMQFPAD